MLIDASLCTVVILQNHGKPHEGSLMLMTRISLLQMMAFRRKKKIGGGGAVAQLQLSGYRIKEGRRVYMFEVRLHQKR